MRKIVALDTFVQRSDLAIASVARWVAGVEEPDQLPEPLAAAMQAMHDAICDVGDAKLRALGYKPEEF